MDYVPIPPFSSEKLAIWFAQVESVFELNGIMSDSDKYDYIVVHIPIECLSLIEDIILNPPAENKYDNLKYEFIKRMIIFHLKTEELGSAKPSEYLHRLRKMGGQRVPIETILNIWLKNLPKPVREIVSLETSGHVDVIGPMADKAMALLLSRAQKNVQLTSDQFQMVIHRVEELQARVVQLMQAIEDVEENRLGDPPARQECTVKGSENKGNSTQRASTSKAICWYHSVFGESAVACITPCQYKPPTIQHV